MSLKRPLVDPTYDLMPTGLQRIQECLKGPCGTTVLNLWVLPGLGRRVKMGPPGGFTPGILPLKRFQEKWANGGFRETTTLHKSSLPV